MSTVAEQARRISRWLIGATDESPVVKGILRQWADDRVFQIEQGRAANKRREAEAAARDLEIRRAVDAEIARDGVSRRIARERVAKARAKAGLLVHSPATVRNADKRAAKRRTGTPAQPK